MAYYCIREEIRICRSQKCYKLLKTKDKGLNNFLTNFTVRFWCKNLSVCLNSPCQSCVHLYPIILQFLLHLNKQKNNVTPECTTFVKYMNSFYNSSCTAYILVSTILTHCIMVSITVGSFRFWLDFNSTFTICVLETVKTLQVVCE